MKAGIWALVLAGWICLAPYARGEDPVGTAERAEKDVRGAVEVRLRTQAGEDDWAAERRKILAALEALETAREQQRERGEELDRRLAERERALASVEAEIAMLAVVEERLHPWLEGMAAQLAGTVRDGLPFLPAERQRRMDELRMTLAAPETAIGEKFRRLFEALTVEMEYGSTVEVTRRRIDLEGHTVVADVLRVGRLALFCQAPDRGASAFFDPLENRWTRLPDKHAASVRRAIEIGARQRSVELLLLPLGKVAPR